jgi:hypothetical protein
MSVGTMDSTTGSTAGHASPSTASTTASTAPSSKTCRGRGAAAAGRGVLACKAFLQPRRRHVEPAQC